jgi:hypothetical protein
VAGRTGRRALEGLDRAGLDQVAGGLEDLDQVAGPERSVGRRGD